MITSATSNARAPAWHLPQQRRRRIDIADVGFTVTDPSAQPEMPSTAGTLTIDGNDQEVSSSEIVTRPGNFCVTGDGICVGRDRASAVAVE
jgi:hypothetical protein